MPPRIKPRLVYWQPGVTIFKPMGIPARSMEIVVINIDEFEAMRLVDLEGLSQEEAAQKMNVSQPTINRLLTSARRKIADALTNGKMIRIEGGNYKYIPPRGMGRHGRGYGRRMI